MEAPDALQERLGEDAWTAIGEGEADRARK